MEIIHVDVYCPLFVVACGGFFNYMKLSPMIRVDGYIYLMRKKSEKYLKWFKEFQHEVEIIVTTKSSIYDWIIEENI